MKAKIIAVAAFALFAGSAAAQGPLGALTGPITSGADVFAGILTDASGALIGDVGNGAAAPGAAIAHGQASGVLGGAQFVSATVSNLTTVLTTTITDGAAIAANAAGSPTDAISSGSALFSNTVEGLLGAVGTAGADGGQMLANNLDNVARAIEHGVTNGSAILTTAIGSGLGGLPLPGLDSLPGLGGLPMAGAAGGLPGLGSLPVGPEALTGLLSTLMSLAPSGGAAGGLPGLDSLPLGPEAVTGLLTSLIGTLTSMAPAGLPLPAM